MLYSELLEILKSNLDKNINFYIGQEKVPPHFHLTEVGRIFKKYIDCGGTKRQELKCCLQLWVADDVGHRLKSSKMLSILEMAKSIFENDEDLNIEIEYEKDLISQFFINNVKIEDEINFYLESNHTACLAPDKCGVSCCPTPSSKLYKIQLYD